MKLDPVRLLIYTGSDARRDLADLTVHAEVAGAGCAEAAVLQSRLGEVARERIYTELEELSCVIAHAFLDTEPSVSQAAVECVAHSWRRLGAHAFEQGSSEVRAARAEIARDGHATVGGAIRGLSVLTGPMEIRTLDLEWQYKKAGTPYNSSWAAVRKMALQALDDQEEPEAMAQLLVDLVPSLAAVQLSMTTELFAGSGGVYRPVGELRRRTAAATCGR